jgi:hypothetical protein
MQFSETALTASMMGKQPLSSLTQPSLNNCCLQLATPLLTFPAPKSTI